MARARINITVLNTAGAPVNGASVSITKRSDGTAATWYTTETGGVGATTAVATDPAGKINAWVDRGAYNLTVSGTGFTTYVEPFDAAPGADNAVDNLWLPDNLITTAEIADGAVTLAKVGTLADSFLRLGSGATGLRFVVGQTTQGYSAVNQKQSTTAIPHGLGHAPVAVIPWKALGQHGDQSEATAATGSLTATTFTLESFLTATAYAFNINITWNWLAIG